MQPFGHNRYGPKIGGSAPPPWGRGDGSPSNTMWPGPRPTGVPSFILIRSTVWPLCTNVTDRTDRQDRQRTDSIGRTVLQTVAQKPACFTHIGLMCSQCLSDQASKQASIAYKGYNIFTNSQLFVRNEEHRTPFEVQVYCDRVPLQISTGFASWQRYCTAFSSGRQPNFAALNRGRHLYSAGRPSPWALAHISSFTYFTLAL